jgi:hypothetical protein
MGPGMGVGVTVVAGTVALGMEAELEVEDSQDGVDVIAVEEEIKPVEAGEVVASSKLEI